MEDTLPWYWGRICTDLTQLGECMKDENVCSFLKKCIFEEIIPTIGDTEDNRKFGAAVLERSLIHLSSISC